MYLLYGPKRSKVQGPRHGKLNGMQFMRSSLQVGSLWQPQDVSIYQHGQCQEGGCELEGYGFQAVCMI